MALLKFVHSNPLNSRLVFSDTKKPPRDKRVVKKIELPSNTNLEDFARQHWPSEEGILEEGYVIVIHETYEMRYINGAEKRVEAPMLYYVAAKR